MRGLLRGMGREEECELLARRSDLSDPRSVQRAFVYSDCVVLTAPGDLPDGDYMLFFAGHSTVGARTRGIWTSFGAVVPDASADGLDEGRTVDPAAMGPARSDGRAAKPEAEQPGKSSEGRGLDREA